MHSKLVRLSFSVFTIKDLKKPCLRLYSKELHSKTSFVI